MLPRREVLKLSAAAAVPAKAATVDPLSPSRRYATLVKLRGALDERVFAGYVEGRYYGYVEGRLVPFYGLLAGTLTQHRRQPDGTFRGVSFELAYFTDWETGELLDGWKNPLTGKTVPVPRFRTAPGAFRITADWRIAFEDAMPGGTNSDRFLKPIAEGDDLWITEENRSEFLATKTEPAFFYNELVTYHGRVADLASPAPWCDTTVAFQSEVSWRPWLEMGNATGHLVGNAAGRKLKHLDAMPARWLAWGRKHHADVFADPVAFLARGWA
jgi:hypothetical protein